MSRDLLGRRARPWGLLAASALSIVGIVTTALLWIGSDRAAELADHDATERAAGAVRAEVERLMGSLRGAGGLAVDGAISADEFREYAADILRFEDFQAVGLVTRVTDDERPALEAQQGGPLQQLGPDGTSAAPSQDVYWVLRYSEPADNPGNAAVGADVAPDPVRRATYRAAAAGGAPVLSSPILGLATGAQSYLVVVPVLVSSVESTPTDYVIATVQVAQILESVDRRLPGGTALAVADGDTALTGAPPGSDATRIAVAGRSLVVSAEDGRSHGHRAALLVLVCTQLAALALVGIARRDRAAQRREAVLMTELAADHERSIRLAELGRAVAVARTPREVVEAAATHARPVLGAASASVGVLDGTGTALDVVTAGGGVSGGVRHGSDPLGRPSPLTAAFTSNAVVVSGDAATIERDHPVAWRSIHAAGVQAIAAAPLDGPDGPIGALTLEWDRPVDIDDTVVNVVSTMTGICAEALNRARMSERRERKARQFAALTQSLATAADDAQVAAALAADASPLLGAGYVSVTSGDDGRSATGGVGPLAAAIHRTFAAAGVDPPSRASSPILIGGRAACIGALPHLAELLAGVHGVGWVPVGERGAGNAGDDVGLCVVWTEPTTFDAGVSDDLRSIAGIVDQTNQRLGLVAAEHQLALALQERILRPLPHIGGLELAAVYVPASRHVNLGGDWYDVVVLGDRVTLIVGDLAGHGLDAISRMTELRALVNGLVHAATPLAHLLDDLAAMNDADDPTHATLQVIQIDLSRSRLQYVSAGHPPPVLVSGDGVRILDGGRAPLIGIPPVAVTTGSATLARGDVVVAYTDGLIERRGQPLDVGLSDLSASLRALTSTEPSAVVDHVLELTTADRHTIDDVVVLAARFTG